MLSSNGNWPSSSRHAQKQQGRAEKNFQRAMDAVDQMLTQVGDKELADVPQLEPIRRSLLLDKALAFYQGLQDENDANPKARHETGLAHRRSGEILALMGKHGRRREGVPAGDRHPDGAGRRIPG